MHHSSAFAGQARALLVAAGVKRAFRMVYAGKTIRLGGILGEGLSDRGAYAPRRQLFAQERGRWFIERGTACGPPIFIVGFGRAACFGWNGWSVE
jgi:hypothetical protein